MPTSSEEVRRLAPQVEAALAFAAGTYTLDDIIAAVGRHEMQWWEFGDSFVLTQIGDYPQFRALTIVLAGGVMADVQSVVPRLYEWAIGMGCQRVQFTGRDGWSRSWVRELGFEPVGTVYEMRLSNGEERSRHPDHHP